MKSIINCLRNCLTIRRPKRLKPIKRHYSTDPLNVRAVEFLRNLIPVAANLLHIAGLGLVLSLPAMFLGLYIYFFVLSGIGDLDNTWKAFLEVPLLGSPLTQGIAAAAMLALLMFISMKVPDPNYAGKKVYPRRLLRILSGLIGILLFDLWTFQIGIDTFIDLPRFGSLLGVLTAQLVTFIVVFVLLYIFGSSIKINDTRCKDLLPQFARAWVWGWFVFISGVLVWLSATLAIYFTTINVRQSLVLIPFVEWDELSIDLRPFHFLTALTSSMAAAAVMYGPPAYRNLTSKFTVMRLLIFFVALGVGLWLYSNNSISESFYIVIGISITLTMLMVIPQRALS